MTINLIFKEKVYTNPIFVTAVLNSTPLDITLNYSDVL